MTRLVEHEYLLKRPRGFYEAALVFIERGLYDIAAFSLEQSLQLYLKAILLKLGMDYPRTHSIRRLLELVYQLTGRGAVNELLDRLGLEISLLEDAYITARHVPKEFTRDVVAKLKRAVEEIVHVIRETTT